MNITEAWDRLMELGVHEQTLQIVTSLNGYTEETLRDVLFCHTGYRSFEQMEDEE